MKYLFAAFIILWVSQANATCTTPCTQSQLLTDINTSWPDNQNNKITPALLRFPITEIVNTYFALLAQFQIPLNTIPIGKGTGINGFDSAVVQSPLVLSGGALSCPTCGGGGSGTVTSASVVTANGFAGTVATATTTPAITLSTSVTGITKGNGTALSAAVAGTDYQAPITLTTTGTSGASTFIGNTLNIPQYSGGGGTPGGSTTQVQYNNAGAFDGITGATTNGTALTLVAPVLGTPASGTLTNTTGFPVANLAGAGTGVLTALAVNVGSAGAPVLFNGALGTPSSGTLTSATGLPISTGVSGLGTGVATFLATPSSANLLAALTTKTGTGNAVFATSPSLTTPNFSSIVNTGTLTLPTSTDTLVGKATTDIFTNKTYDTAGTGNSFSINGVTANANTGTGAVVRATSPALVTPALGTPASATLTNATGLVPSTGLAASGTPSASTFLRGDNSWQTVSGSGDVVGPASATANGFAVFNGTTGKLIKDHAATIALGSEVSGILPVANGGTADSGTGGTSFTPTVTCGAGSGTWVYTNSAYKTIGKLVFFSVSLSLTAVGTCSGIPNFALPVTSAASPISGTIRENNVGAAYFAWGATSSGTMSFATAANGAPTLASGNIFIGNFWYIAN